MRHILRFILRHHFFFLFLLLEVISLSLVVNNNYQRSTFLNATSETTGSILRSLSTFSDYFALRRSNEQLAKENARLRSQLKSSLQITDREIYTSADTLYRYVSAKVIRNTVTRQKNYLMLNKGSRHGIRNDMGVVSPGGIVGKVVNVSQNYCVVMSVLHTENKINSRILKNNQLGNVKWDGVNYRKGMLVDIPTHVVLNRGDTIVTSGNSLMFPEGIMVGTVDEYYTQTGEKFHRASVDFSTDYNNLLYAYVIINLMRDEQNAMEKQIPDE